METCRIHIEGKWHDQGYNNAIDDVLFLIRGKKHIDGEIVE